MLYGVLLKRVTGPRELPEVASGSEAGETAAQEDNSETEVWGRNFVCSCRKKLIASLSIFGKFTWLCPSALISLRTSLCLMRLFDACNSSLKVRAQDGVWRSCWLAILLGTYLENLRLR